MFAPRLAYGPDFISTNITGLGLWVSENLGGRRSKVILGSRLQLNIPSALDINCDCRIKCVAR